MTPDPDPLFYTRSALALYDLSAGVRGHNWIHSHTPEQLALAKAADRAAENEVRTAFYRDTKETNSLLRCMAAPIGWIRALCGRPGPLPVQELLEAIDLLELPDLPDPPKAA